MLDYLRQKQGALWIVIAVVVIISFAFFGNAIQPKPPGVVGPEDTAFTIYGKSHSNAELGRLLRLHSLSTMLNLQVPSVRMQGAPVDFATVMSYVARSFQFEDSIQPDFAFNLLVLRNELKKHGIYVSDEEAREAYRNLPIFKNEKGEFDAARAEFIQTNIDSQLGAMGMRLSDIYELLRDWLGLTKLAELVSNNVVTSDHLTNVFYAQRFHNIRVATIPFSLETYKKDIKVTDEEVTKYFEERKDSFKTQEKRAVSYVYFPSPEVEKLSEEERQKALNGNAEKINEFALAVIAPNASLGEEAKKAGLEVKTVPAFSRLELPDELKMEFRLVAEIFDNDPQTRPISDPVEGSKGYYVFSVTEVQAPKPQTLEVVKENIKETLLTQKADEALAKAANETRKNVEELIKSGKSFADACKEAGVEAQNLADFSLDNPLTDLSNGQEIAFAAVSTPAGSFTKEPVSASTGLLLVYVVNKELHKRDTSVEDKKQMRDTIEESIQFSIFSAWFERRREEAKLDAGPIIQRTLSADSAS